MRNTNKQLLSGQAMLSLPNRECLVWPADPDTCPIGIVSNTQDLPASGQDSFFETDLSWLRLQYPAGARPPTTDPSKIVPICEAGTVCVTICFLLVDLHLYLLWLLVTRASLLGARTLLGTPGLTTRNKKLLVPKGIATRSKDATRDSWPYYQEQEAISTKGHRY